MLLYVLIYALRCSIASTEIISLLSQEDITCVVTGDTASSAVFLRPPVKTGFQQRSVEINSWTNDDWDLVNSLQTNSNVISDKRWQDFTTLDESNGHAITGSHSIPFSICVYQNVDVGIDVLSEDFVNEIWLNFTPPERPKKSNHCNWYHFTMKKQNTSLSIYSDDRFIQSFDTGFDPFWIYFKNLEGKSVAWKLHDYDYKAATTITATENNKSTLSVNFTDNLCVSMYLSVDKNSFLEISLTSQSGYTKNKTVIGFNENGSKEWKRFEIKAEEAGLGQLSFKRGLKDQSDQNGYWAIDEATFCSKDTEIYQASLKDEAPGEYICELLNESTESKPKYDEYVLSCDKPGFLGKNCTISCVKVLGPNHTYCQKHKICQDISSCFCSWGYEGEHCEQTCAPGKWNTFCKSECKPECSQTCYPSTGECLTPEMKAETLQTIEKNLPINVTLSSTKMSLYWPRLDEEFNDITYSSIIQCTNKWCASQAAVVDLPQHQSVLSVIHVTNATPFTNYKVSVRGNLYNQPLEKTYDVVRTDPPLTLNNLTIYSSTSNSLWIRFALPETPNVDISAYKIWYHEQDSESSPKFVANISQCQFWDKFVCAQLTHLVSNARYSIKIESEGSGMSKLIVGETIEHEPEAPEKFQILTASNHEAMVSWNYPSIPNGSLHKFVVEVEGENTTKHYSLQANEYERSYQLTFPVEHDTDYKISVRAFNSFEGKANKIFARFISIDRNFSFHKDVLVETCSTVCYWLIPKPIEFNEKSTYKIWVIPFNKTKDFDIIEFLASNLVDQEYLRVNLDDDDVRQFLQKTRRNYSLKLQDNYGKLFNISGKPAILEESFLSWRMILSILISLLATSLVLCILTKKWINNMQVQNGLHQAEGGTLISEKEDIKNTKYRKIETRLLESYLKRILLGGKQLCSEFRSQTRVTRPTVHAFHGKNRNKNKDNDNIPYDHNRVILEKLEGLGADDYINASYINGLDRPKAYIATQGPKFCTIQDFWRMIWQEHIETIVMTTDFVENRERKCAEYFPQYIGSIFECGEMLIKLENEEFYEHYHARYLEVEYKGQIRNVRHFLLRWQQDELKPMYPNYIVPLVKKIRAIRENSETPILIHCSSGSDRTGTLILCDLALHMAKTTKSVDFLSLLKNLRQQRPNMISDEKQYILAHLVVLECLMEEENVFKKSITENFNFSVFNEQLDYLNRLSWHDTVITSYSNPYGNLHNYLYYPVDGYATHKKYLTSEQPNQNTLLDFWKMVIQDNIETIVLLNKQNYRMWPFCSRQNDIIFTVKEIKSKKSSPIKLSINVFQSTNNYMLFGREIVVIQANNFNQELYVNNTQEFIRILETVDENYARCERLPILVACSDGITDCGVFVTMDYIIQKCKNEFEADVCNAIRTVRRSGVPFIRTPVELQFLYEGIVEYVQKDEKYSNIL